jgi:acyl-CoA synthetase (NDP forming)
VSVPDLARLLRPRSVAVAGGKPAAEVVRQLRRLGYAGAIWPVHPHLDAIEGLPVHRSFAALPAAPDAAFLGVNRHATVALVRELAELGAGGAVCYASGFAETGPEGAALQQALVAAAGAMPVLGPNCYGLLNYLDGAALWPDQHGGARTERGVAIVTQSGNIGCNITMQRRALPLGYLVTLGNQAVVGLSAAIAALAADPRVSTIGLHSEGIDDPAAFAAAVAAARAEGKPVVALKTGGSAAGARLAVSHTASLAGEDAVADAFFRRIGVARVASLPVLLETLKLLHFGGALPGRAIVSMSCSGGEAALMADRAEGRRLRLREFTPAQHAAVAATLSPLVTVSNPLDYHTFSWADRTALAATFTAVLRCGFDLAALILDFPRTDRCAETDWLAASDALAAASIATGRRAAIIATLPECLPEARAAELLAAGLVPLLGLDDALAAIEAAADLGAFRPASPPAAGTAPSGRPRLLEEGAAKQALAAHGLPVPAGRTVHTAAEAVAAAEALGWPVVLKSVGLAHKTEHGAVRLGLRDPAALRAAAAELAPLGTALLVEQMVTDGVAEVIVGVARDPALGPYLVLGAGGVLAELAADRAILMLPASAEAIRESLDGLRVGALLRGHRGRPPGDLAALVRAVAAVQDYAMGNLPRLIELDVNPIIVRPRGVVAVDALIRLTEEDA